MSIVKKLTCDSCHIEIDEANKEHLSFTTDEDGPMIQLMLAGKKVIEEFHIDFCNVHCLRAFITDLVTKEKLDVRTSSIKE